MNSTLLLTIKDKEEYQNIDDILIKNINILFAQSSTKVYKSKYKKPINILKTSKFRLNKNKISNKMVLILNKVSETNIEKLTIEFINETRNNIEQKQQRKNLKIFQLLKTNEGMDEFRTLIHQKMNLGQIKYSELEKEYSDLGLNQDDLYQSNTVEDDNMDDRKFYNVQTDELDENFNDGNMVFDAEEDDIEDAEFIL